LLAIGEARPADARSRIEKVRAGASSGKSRPCVEDLGAVDVLVAIDAVNDLMYPPRRWTRLPILRINQTIYEQRVEKMRFEIETLLREPGRSSALQLTNRLEVIGRRRRLPVAGGVLVNPNKVLDVLDELRQVLPAAIVAQRNADLRT
jgi:hypothetical protein